MGKLGPVKSRQGKGDDERKRRENRVPGGGWGTVQEREKIQGRRRKLGEAHRWRKLECVAVNPRCMGVEGSPRLTASLT